VTFYIYSPYFHQVAGSGDDVPVKNISNGQRVTIVSGVPWGFWGTPSCGVFQMLKSHEIPGICQIYVSNLIKITLAAPYQIRKEKTTARLSH